MPSLWSSTMMSATITIMILFLSSCAMVAVYFPFWKKDDQLNISKNNNDSSKIGAPPEAGSVVAGSVAAEVAVAGGTKTGLKQRRRKIPDHVDMDDDDEREEEEESEDDSNDTTSELKLMTSLVSNFEINEIDGEQRQRRQRQQQQLPSQTDEEEDEKDEKKQKRREPQQQQQQHGEEVVTRPSSPLHLCSEDRVHRENEEESSGRSRSSYRGKGSREARRRTETESTASEHDEKYDDSGNNDNDKELDSAPTSTGIRLGIGGDNNNNKKKNYDDECSSNNIKKEEKEEEDGEEDQIKGEVEVEEDNDEDYGQTPSSPPPPRVIRTDFGITSTEELFDDMLIMIDAKDDQEEEDFSLPPPFKAVPLLLTMQDQGRRRRKSSISDGGCDDGSGGRKSLSPTSSTAIDRGNDEVDVDSNATTTTAAAPAAGTNEATTTTATKKAMIDLLPIIELVWYDHIHPLLDFKDVYYAGKTCKTMQQLTRTNGDDGNNKKLIVHDFDMNVYCRNSSTVQHVSNAYTNGISLNHIKSFHISYLFTDYHSEDDVEKFELFVTALQQQSLSSMTLLDIEFNRIYHYRGDTNSIWDDLYRQFATQLVENCPGLKTLQIHMNAPTLPLLNSIAHAIRNGRQITNLQLNMSNLVEYTDERGVYGNAKMEVQNFANALITASHITCLSIVLDVCYFQQVILPAIEKSNFEQPQLRCSCRELHFNFVNGGETMGTLSETDITTIFEHFGVDNNCFQTIYLNLQNLRAHSFRPFAYALETFLRRRQLTKEVAVELCSDKEALFAELLTSFAVTVPIGHPSKITYYVTGTRPKRGYINILEDRLMATKGGRSYALKVGSKQDPFTWILNI